MRKNLALCVLLITTCLCTGCWDVEEVNRRALPNTLYFDIGQEDKVRLGIDMHVPGTLLPPVNNMEQQFEKNHETIYAEGKTSVEAWSKLQTMTSRNIFFGQLRAIILTDKFAGQDIENSLDFIGRIPFVTSDTQLLVTKEDPQSLVDLKNKTNLIPGNYIEQYFQSPYKELLAEPISLWEVFANIDNKTEDPHFPLISTSQGNYVISGTALFSGTRMAGELDQRETYVFSLLRGGKTGLLSVPLSDNNIVSYLQTYAKTRINPKYNSDGDVVFEIKIKAEGMLAEINPYPGNMTMEDKERINSNTADYIKNEVEQLLAKLKELNTDPVGFGESFRSKYPEIWKKTEWHDIYPQARFLVNVDFNVKKTGLFR